MAVFLIEVNAIGRHFNMILPVYGLMPNFKGALKNFRQITSSKSIFVKYWYCQVSNPVMDGSK